MSANSHHLDSNHYADSHHSGGPSVKQIKAIKTLSRLCGQTRDDYETMLREGFKVASCKDLHGRQVDDLIEHLSRLNGQLNQPVPRPDRAFRYDHLRGRPAFLASPAQLRLVDVLWSQVTRQPEGPERLKALEHFLRNRFRIGGMEWLKKRDVQKVVAAINAMKNQALEKREAAQEVAA